jgi:four helix bundle protein
MFRRFEQIEVWQRGCRLAVRIYELCEREPLSKDWGLRDQLRRAAVSIPSNIAEGYERNSRIEFRRFLLIAKGSSAELRTQLYLLKALKAYPTKEVDALVQECAEISSMIQSLIQNIQRKLPK